MSKAGCLYVNAVMEYFYNTFKREYLNIHHFKNNNESDLAFYEFINIKYNHMRPHRYNRALTPYALGCAV